MGSRGVLTRTLFVWTWRLSDSLKSSVFEDEGLSSDGFELDDDSCVLAWGGFHDDAFTELGVGDGASDGVLTAVV